jgi:hypothetical protein
MSDIEIYWQRIAKAWGDNRSWNQLHPQEQIFVIQSVNMLLQVLKRNPEQNTQAWG